MEYEFHPIAGLFPLIEGDEFQQLCDSIESIGLTQPIVLWKGQILDGRNRYRACMARGIQPEFEEFEGDDRDAAEFVAAGNLHRRNLSASQRAMILAQMGTAYGLTVKQASVVGGVSEKTIGDARAVIASGDSNVVSMVRSGEMPVHKGAELVRSGPGRPQGNAKVNALRATIRQASKLNIEDASEICDHWTGSVVELKLTKKKLDAFLKALEGRNLREASCA